MNDIIKNKCKINFAINPQIELLSVIQVLAEEPTKEYKDYYFNNEYYINEIKSFFKNYKEHPVIKNYRNYYVNNSQIFKYRFDNNKLVLDDDNVDDRYKEYLLLLNDFIEISNYIEFFNKMATYYNDVLNKNIENISNVNIIDDLIDYYQKTIKIKVILKMIQGDWGEYLCSNKDEYTITCGISKMQDYPVFINDKQLTSLCFHECTHPFINEYLSNDYDLLCKTENLFLKIDLNSTARKNYYTYNDYLEDLVVRAVTANLHYKYGYSTLEEYNKELEFMNKIGFIYIKDIADILNNNDFYSSINLIKEYLLSNANDKNK